jgi:hypothetical protein
MNTEKAFFDLSAVTIPTKHLSQNAVLKSTGPAKVLDVGSLLSLGALCHFKADLLAFPEGLEAAHVDCGIVRKQILAPIIGRDETKTLCIVKPFNCPGCHDSSFFKKTGKAPASLGALPIHFLYFHVVCVADEK